VRAEARAGGSGERVFVMMVAEPIGNASVCVAEIPPVATACKVIVPLALEAGM